MGLGELTPAERRVVEALLAGDVADLRPSATEGEAPDDCARVRAALVRAIVRGLAIPHAQIDPRGLRLRGARFDERIDLDDTTFPRPLTFTGCVLTAGLTAARAELHSVMVDDTVVGAGATDRGSSRSAVDLAQAKLTHNLQLIGSEFTGSGDRGAVRLLGAHLGGQLDCEGGTFTNDTGPAVIADNLTADSDVRLTGQFTGSSDLGTVRLSGAHLGGQLDCEGGTFTNDTGPALYADNLTTDNNVYLAGQFTGSGPLGTVRLLGAHLGGELTCEGGRFANSTGPALHADNLTTDSNVRLTGQFTGSGPRGTVRLSGAHLGGQLICGDRGSLQSGAPGALVLSAARVDGELFLSPGFRTAGTPVRWLDLDGLTYTGLPLGAGGVGTWVSILAHQTTSYAAQPWQHLAAAWRATGHESEAKRVLIAQQDDRRQRVLHPTGPLRSTWHQWLRYWGAGFMKLLTGYGYRISRTWACLLIWTALGLIAGLATGFVHVTAPTEPGRPPTVTTVAAHAPTTADPAGAPCSLIERAGLGLAWAIPLVSAGTDSTCTLNTTAPAGQWMTLASWVLNLGGWALATLVVAGYTGIVRRL